MIQGFLWHHINLMLALLALVIWGGSFGYFFRWDAQNFWETRKLRFWFGGGARRR